MKQLIILSIILIVSPLALAKVNHKPATQTTAQQTNSFIKHTHRDVNYHGKRYRFNTPTPSLAQN